MNGGQLEAQVRQRYVDIDKAVERKDCGGAATYVALYNLLRTKVVDCLSELSLAEAHNVGSCGFAVHDAEYDPVWSQIDKYALMALKPLVGQPMAAIV